jgi:hypothetical protein
LSPTAGRRQQRLRPGVLQFGDADGHRVPESLLDTTPGRLPEPFARKGEQFVQIHLLEAEAAAYHFRFTPDGCTCSRPSDSYSEESLPGTSNVHVMDTVRPLEKAPFASRRPFWMVPDRFARAN